MPHPFRPADCFLSRRELLSRCGMGMGMLGLSSLLAATGGLRAEEKTLNPLTPKPPQFPAKAKRVIHIFANGGPSHVDTFDPKPKLTEYHGKMFPRPNLGTERKTGAAWKSPFEFKRYGKSGLEVSEIFRHVGECADDLCVIRSMHADVPNHEPSLLLMNCGEARLIRPSFGSWLTYGLGSENQNLPGFVVMCPGGYPIQESPHILDLYGPGVHARQLLYARRMIERGVRFVQVWHGDGQPWDNHDDLEVNHRRLAQQCDQPIAALLKDLKQRGLLDETLVIWRGELGRTPV